MAARSIEEFSMSRYPLLQIVLCLLVLTTGCANTDNNGNNGNNGNDMTDSRVVDASREADSGSPPVCDETRDEDGDGIPNGIEGCKSDRDSDGDGTPDWRDVDSDGDGVADGDEDVNGDGQVGCCLESCNQPTTQQSGCTLGADGCGPGQTCKSGRCEPAVAFVCSNGETDSKAEDSFGDGVKDKDRGSFICRDATETDPRGRKKVQLFRSKDPKVDTNSGDWHIAAEPDAVWGELTLDSPKASEAAAVIEHKDAAVEVAGFVLAMSAPDAEQIGPLLDDLIKRIQDAKPGGTTQTSLRAIGSVSKSHDKFDAVHHTTLDLELGTALDVATVRSEVVAALLDRSPATLKNAPAAYGQKHTRLLVSFSVVRRFEFARDAQNALVLDDNGYPKEDVSQKAKRRVLVIGAVAAADNYRDPSRKTALVVDDLAGGSQLATYADRVANECDVGKKAAAGKADIIWVIDESQSVTDLTAAVRDGIKRAAGVFYQRAAAAGLDFRLGVTGIVSPASKHNAVRGKLCSEVLSDPDAVGGDAKQVDRFLLPTEQALFEGCIQNPYGREGGAEYGLHTARVAIERHQQAGLVASGGVLRSDAKTVVIIATDEPAKTTIDATFIPNSTKSCQFGSQLARDVRASVDPYISFFRAEKVDVHLIGFICPSLKTCALKDQNQRGIAHGYLEVVRELGGIIGDVCQKDMGKTMQAIVDSITGAASPIKLERVPIAPSLAVAVAGKQVARSRESGFDYNASKNSIVFYGGVAKTGDDVIVSYKRWNRQVTIK
jgi:hypothetical protein